MKNIEIRNLNINDIEEMTKARINQETENGNYLDENAISAYKEILKKLFLQNKIIAFGAFKNTNLISLACFNLINFGSSKEIPYLCAVWTNPKYRGNGLSNEINNKLFETIKANKENFASYALLTLEGNEAAYNLYKKLGYEEVTGEMSFLGDISDNNKYSNILTQNGNQHTITYIQNKEKILDITFTEEQLFSHPSNINGILTRILKITPYNLEKNNLYYCLQSFFSHHRFCKLNVNELMENEEIIKYFSSAKDLEEYLKSLNFKDINEKKLCLASAHNVMKKSLQ